MAFGVCGDLDTNKNFLHKVLDTNVGIVTIFGESNEFKRGSFDIHWSR